MKKYIITTQRACALDSINHVINCLRDAKKRISYPVLMRGKLKRKLCSSDVTNATAVLSETTFDMKHIFADLFRLHDMLEAEKEER